MEMIIEKELPKRITLLYKPNKYYTVSYTFQVFKNKKRKLFYIGTENTITQERYDAAFEKALAYRNADIL
jgi:hypothetical protein